MANEKQKLPLENKMEIKELPIGSIKNDSDQPRKVFDRESVQEMADSFKTTSIINPIEVDENNVIVTGEIRWRAAKLAGLKTVPCKIISIKKEDRLLRQLVENLHKYEMKPYDLGIALKAILAHTRQIRNSSSDKGYKKLAQLIGKSESFVSEHIALVEQLSKPLQKAVRDGKVPATTAVRVVTRVPEKYKKQVQNKMLRGEFKSRDGALSFASAMEREQDNPKTIKKLLQHDYSKYDSSQAIDSAVRTISPDESDMFRASLEPAEQMRVITDELKRWLKNYSFKDISPIQKMEVKMTLTFLTTTIKDWLAGVNAKK